MEINPRSRRIRRVALIVLALALLPTALLGMRTYRSLALLQSAYAAGAAKTSSIRPWMTLAYVATSFRIPNARLIAGLGLPAGTDPQTSLKSLADQDAVSPLEYVQRIQRIVAEGTRNGGAEPAGTAPGWLGAIADWSLTALLVYGYPVLGVTLLLGAIGLPLPDGIVTTVAGSLAAQGRMSLAWAAALAVIASVLGDAVGYGLGRLLGREVIERHGGWFGYTAARRARVQRLFDRWGSLTVFITRSFVSYLSSIASLLAGASRHDLTRFVIAATAGRVVWAAAYLGLGYEIGGDWEAATGFLANLSVLVIVIVALAACGVIASQRIAAGGRLR